MPRSRWQVDAAHTAVEFSVKHMMFTTAHGRFTGVAGTIEVDEEHPERSSVEVTIDASSVDTANADRDKHLRSADFFDVEKHPQITFKSRKVQGAAKKEGDRFKVVGDLTIRGETQEVTLECTYLGMGRDPWGGTRAGFHAETKIDRREWGLRWNQALETGGILVANEVKLELDVQAVRMEQSGKQAAA
jgi:polyisoprenoid-binding protein YceI